MDFQDVNTDLNIDEGIEDEHGIPLISIIKEEPYLINNGEEIIFDNNSFYDAIDNLENDNNSDISDNHENSNDINDNENTVTSSDSFNYNINLSNDNHNNTNLSSDNINLCNDNIDNVIINDDKNNDNSFEVITIDDDDDDGSSTDSNLSQNISSNNDIEIVNIIIESNGTYYEHIYNGVITMDNGNLNMTKDVLKNNDKNNLKKLKDNTNKIIINNSDLNSTDMIYLVDNDSDYHNDNLDNNSRILVLNNNSDNLNNINSSDKIIFLNDNSKNESINFLHNNVRNINESTSSNNCEVTANSMDIGINKNNKSTIDNVSTDNSIIDLDLDNDVNVPNNTNRNNNDNLLVLLLTNKITTSSYLHMDNTNDNKKDNCFDKNSVITINDDKIITDNVHDKLENGRIIKKVNNNTAEIIELDDSSDDDNYYSPNCKMSNSYHDSTRKSYENNNNDNEIDMPEYIESDGFDKNLYKKYKLYFEKIDNITNKSLSTSLHLMKNDNKDIKDNNCSNHYDNVMTNLNVASYEYLCEMCGLHFNTVKYLKLHKSITHNEKQYYEQYKCVICKKIFITKLDFDRHIASCCQITKIFSKSSNVNQKTIKNRSNKNKCNLNHKKINKMKIYKCQICNKYFINLIKFYKHICDINDFSFRDKESTNCKLQYDTGT